MRFGWLTLGLSPSADGDYAAIREQVTQACFAETTGFDGIWLTEHNFTGESVYCDPIPFASVVAARTSRIRIGFAVIQLALRHPIRLLGLATPTAAPRSTCIPSPATFTSPMRPGS